MNIHEHQAKDILRKYGAPVSNGVVINSLDEINRNSINAPLELQDLGGNIYMIMMKKLTITP